MNGDTTVIAPVIYRRTATKHVTRSFIDTMARFNAFLQFTGATALMMIRGRVMRVLSVSPYSDEFILVETNEGPYVIAWYTPYCVYFNDAAMNEQKSFL